MKRHNIIFVENNKCKEDLEYFGLKVKSMGRNYDEDSEFSILQVVLHII